MVADCLCRLDLTCEELAIAEIEEVFSTTCTRIDNKWVSFTVDCSQEDVEQKSKHLALSKITAHTIAVGNTIRSCCTNAAPLIENSYSLRINFTAHAPHTHSRRECADMLYHAMEQPVVDIHSPSNEYLILIDAEKTYCAKICSENLHATQRYADRGFNHPTSINPKIAGAMINLAGEGSVLDPFCGRGSLLVLAGIQSRAVSGGDLDEKMVRCTRINCEKHNVDADIRVRDALLWTGQYDAIVTDLPYGKNSFISEDPAALYRRFLAHATSLSGTIVICLLTKHNIHTLIESLPLRVKRQISYRIHRSMTRQIVLLQRM